MSGRSTFFCGGAEQQGIRAGARGYACVATADSGERSESEREREGHAKHTNEATRRKRGDIGRGLTASLSHSSGISSSSTA